MTEDSSITHRAYIEIRAALISCRLAPSSRLNIAQLQREIGVSQAAVREALSRLTAEGLATIERNSGFRAAPIRSEEHTSELKSLMRISYAVFCLKKKKTQIQCYKHTNK